MSEQSIVAALLRDRIRLVVENHRLSRELEREREARLAVERDRDEGVAETQDIDSEDAVVFGEPTARRSTHLRIVSRSQLMPVIDPTEFAE
jgi:hypothetical protein